MCPSVRLCLLLLLSVMVSVSGRRSDRLTDSSSSSVSRIKLEPFWTGETFRPRGEELVDSPAVPEQDVMLTDPSEPGDVAIAGRRRSARGADQQDEEQQSTFGQSYENDSVTTPRDTDFDADNSDSNATELTPPASDEDAAGTILDDENPGDSGRDAANNNNNGSSPGLFFNPFYPLEKEGSYVAYAVLFLGGTVLAVGVVGNMAVMCVVWNNYYMRSAWNYLLASMAFWDFLVLVLCLPVVVINQLSHRRILGDITCRMVPYMEVTSLGITSFSLCALGVDRFTAATSSTAPKARRVARCRSVLLKLLLVWLTALMLSSPELFLWQLTRTMSLASGATVDSCSLTPPSPLSLYLPDYLHSLLLRYHQARMWWCFGAYFCLPVLFTALCQLATCNVNSDYDSTHKKRLPVCGDDPLSGQKRAQQQSAERQLGCTVLALAVVYGVCALPEHVVSITLAYARVDVSTDTAAMLALLRHFLLFFKCSVTPVLLLCLCKALGQHFMDCCCCCCQECQPDTPPGTPSSAQVKLKTANEVASSSIFFDKAKETSAILSISS